MSKKVSVQMLSTDYLNSYFHGNISKDEPEKDISNLNITIKNDNLHVMWNDCDDIYWKQNLLLKSKNQIPSSIFANDLVVTIDEKNKYANKAFVDKDIQLDTLYCYRIFTEFSNSDEFYSGFKNIFFVYVYDESQKSSAEAFIEAGKILLDPEHRFVTDDQIAYWNSKADSDDIYTKSQIDQLFLNNKIPIVNATQNGIMTSDMYIKLNRLENYVHPSTHPASMITGLANVATSGDYNDLINTPDLPPVSLVGQTGNYEDLKNKPNLATVATTGSYLDLIDKPVILEASRFARVAFTGNYIDLLNKPNISSVGLSGNYNDLLNKPNIPNFADVAVTGDYNDLINKPIIAGMPNLADVALSGDYNDLINKPDISQTLNLAKVASTGSYKDLNDVPIIPTTAKQISIQDSKNIINSTDVEDALSELKTDIDNINSSLTQTGNQTQTLTKYVYEETDKGLTIQYNDNRITINKNGSLYYNDKLIEIGTIDVNVEKILEENHPNISIDVPITVSKTDVLPIVIYFNESDNNVYCYTFNESSNSLSIMWKFDPESKCVTKIATEDINNDGNIEILIPTSNGQLICLNTNGGLLWKFENSYYRNGSGSITSNTTTTLTDNTKLWKSDSFKYDLNNNGLYVRINNIDYLIDNFNGTTININPSTPLPTGLTGQFYQIRPVDEKNMYIQNTGLMYTNNNKNYLVIAENNGTLTNLLLNGNSFQFDWEYPVNKPLLVSPQIVNNEIICIDIFGVVYSIGINGSLLWTTNLQENTMIEFLSYDLNEDGNDEILIPTGNGICYVLDYNGNIINNTKSFNDNLLCGPVINEYLSKTFILGYESGIVSAFDEYANCKWTTKLLGSINSSPNSFMLGNNVIFVITNSAGCIYLIDTDGKIIKTIHAHGEIISTVDVIQRADLTEASIFVNTTNGNIYGYSITQITI